MSTAELEILIKARDDASRVLGGVEQKASGLGDKLRLAVVGGALAGAAAITAFGVSSINAAADYEHAISQVGAVSQSTGKDLDALSDKGLQIGKDTAFGATEAAQAMEILASNGVSATDILGGAADATVALAAAGGTDLRLAADAASTSMTVWNLKSSEMTDVVNRLAGAANVSRFGVEDMAGAVAQGGGAAATAGVEFGDFATTIAAIAPSFSSGSDAGTSFKTFLTGLGGSSDTAKDKMRELGLITRDGSNAFYDAQGNLKSMADITDILHNATKDLTEQERLNALQVIFGTDAMRAAAGIAQLTGDEFAAMSDTMKNTDATEVAAQRMDNFKGSMDQLKGSLEVLQIQVGMKLLPVLSELALWAAAAIPAATDRAGPALEMVFGVLETGYEILEPLLDLIAEHPEVIMAMVGAWAAFKALDLAASIANTIASLNAWAIAVGAAQAQQQAFQLGAMALRGALMTGGVLGALVLLPPAIDMVQDAYSNADEKQAAFAGGTRVAADIIGAAVDDMNLVRLRNELQELNTQFEETGWDQFESGMAGVVQAAVDAGATIPEVLTLIKDAGVENVPAVQKVLEDLRGEIGANLTADRELDEGFFTAIKHTRATADAEIPAIGEQFTGFTKTVLATKDDTSAALAELRQTNHDTWEDMATAVQSLHPTLEEEVDLWLEEMARAAEVYTGYDANLQTVFAALQTRHAEHFETLGNIVLEATPEQVAGWAQLATENTGAFDQGMQDLASVTGSNIEAAKTRATEMLPSFQQQFIQLGMSASSGLSAGAHQQMMAEAANLEATFGIPAHIARKVLETGSPSRVFIGIGENIIEGLEIGISETKRLEDLLAEISQMMTTETNKATRIALSEQKALILAQLDQLDASIQQHFAGLDIVNTMTMGGEDVGHGFADGVVTGVTDADLPAFAQTMGHNIIAGLEDAISETKRLEDLLAEVNQMIATSTSDGMTVALQEQRALILAQLDQLEAEIEQRLAGLDLVGDMTMGGGSGGGHGGAGGGGAGSGSDPQFPGGFTAPGFTPSGAGHVGPFDAHELSAIAWALFADPTNKVANFSDFNRALDAEGLGPGNLAARLGLAQTRGVDVKKVWSDWMKSRPGMAGVFSIDALLADLLPYGFKTAHTGFEGILGGDTIFSALRGEHVKVTPPGGGGGGPTIVQNVTIKPFDLRDARRHIPDLMQDLKREASRAYR